MLFNQLEQTLDKYCGLVLLDYNDIVMAIIITYKN